MIPQEHTAESPPYEPKWCQTETGVSKKCFVFIYLFFILAITLPKLSGKTEYLSNKLTLYALVAIWHSGNLVVKPGVLPSPSFVNQSFDLTALHESEPTRAFLVALYAPYNTRPTYSKQQPSDTYTSEKETGKDGCNMYGKYCSMTPSVCMCTRRVISRGVTIRFGLNYFAFPFQISES